MSKRFVRCPPLTAALRASRDRARKYAERRGYTDHGLWLTFLMADFAAIESMPNHKLTTRTRRPT